MHRQSASWLQTRAERYHTKTTTKKKKQPYFVFFSHALLNASLACSFATNFFAVPYLSFCVVWWVFLHIKKMRNLPKGHTPTFFHYLFAPGRSDDFVIRTTWNTSSYVFKPFLSYLKTHMEHGPLQLPAKLALACSSKKP